MALLVLVPLLACGGAERRQDAALDHGRRYTAMLYDGQFERLWERFSPELRNAFGSPAELGEFAGRALAQLGREQGRPAEAVTSGERDRIYSRVAAFERAPDSMVIQWTLADDGEVTGFVVRPASPDSAAPPPGTAPAQ